MKKFLIIKLGGSVITYKDSSNPKARISVIRRLAKEIKKVTDLGFQIVLVHGAGSFAHGLMKKNNIHKGMKTEKQIFAFGQVTNQMSKLNSIVVQHLLRAGVKAVGIVPHTFITQTNGKLKDLNLEIVKTYLKSGVIPVISGNLVLDDKWGCSPLSGDTITTYIGKKLKAHRVIFLSDVDGIFESDPKKNPNAKIIKEINNSNIDQVLKVLSSTGRDDVTGEMYGKILEIKNNLKQIEVVLVDGLKEGRLIQAARGDLVGTRLLLP